MGVRIINQAIAIHTHPHIIIVISLLLIRVLLTFDICVSAIFCISYLILCL